MDDELTKDGADNVRVEDVVLRSLFGELFNRLTIISNRLISRKLNFTELFFTLYFINSPLHVILTESIRSSSCHLS